MIDSYGEKVEIIKDDNYRWFVKYNAATYVIDFFGGEYFLGQERKNKDSDPSYIEIFICSDPFDLARYIVENILD